jgi:hypothetical protein
MKLTKKTLQTIIKEELSLIESNQDKRSSAVSPMTGQQHFGKLPSDDAADKKGGGGSIPIEMDQEANADGDAYWVMVDDLVTSIGRQRASRIEGSDDEVYIRTGREEGITVKVVRRGQ